MCPTVPSGWAVSSNRSSFSWGTFQSKPQSST
jgi:hypothetical protein